MTASRKISSWQILFVFVFTKRPKKKKKIELQSKKVITLNINIDINEWKKVEESFLHDKVSVLKKHLLQKELYLL